MQDMGGQVARQLLYHDPWDRARWDGGKNGKKEYRLKSTVEKTRRQSSGRQMKTCGTPYEGVKVPPIDRAPISYH